MPTDVSTGSTKYVPSISYDGLPDEVSSALRSLVEGIEVAPEQMELFLGYAAIVATSEEGRRIVFDEATESAQIADPQVRDSVNKMRDAGASPAQGRHQVARTLFALGVFAGRIAESQVELADSDHPTLEEGEPDEEGAAA